MAGQHKTAALPKMKDIGMCGFVFVHLGSVQQHLVNVKEVMSSSSQGVVANGWGVQAL